MMAAVLRPMADRQSAKDSYHVYAYLQCEPYSDLDVLDHVDPRRFQNRNLAY